MKILFKLLLIFLVFVNIVGCTESKDNTESKKEIKSVTGNQISEPIDSLINLIITKGDINSFQRAGIYFLDYNPKAFLPICIKMLAFQNYCYANMEAYFSIEDLYYGKPSTCPEKILAIHFLDRALQCGEKQALEYKNEMELKGENFDTYLKVYSNSEKYYQNYLDSLCETINKEYNLY